jgi:ACS family hexuronate transporter-like MFS transporter
MAAGRWLDWIGTRIGYAVALVSWSVASMLHAVVGSAWGFGIARGLLGVTESPAYPAATKTLAEWFPRKERALAMGFVNAGSNIGAIAAPMLVPWLALNFGWQWAFIVTGAIGLVWIVFWIPLYRHPQEHPRVSAKELAHINSDPAEPAGRVRWSRLLTHRQTWGFALGKFMTDPIWSFYLFWFPSFLHDRHGVGLNAVAAPLIVAYVMADFGSIAGGWFSSRMIHRGWTVNRARKTAIVLSTICILPAAFTSVVDGMWTATLIVGLALAGHQGFSSNLYTLVSDTYPKRAVGSVAGMGGTFGYIGYTLFGILTGWILTVTHKNYTPSFIICALAYVVAFLCIHVLMPRLEPVKIGNEPGFPVLPAESDPN